jgi:hypothetical protein
MGFIEDGRIEIDTNAVERSMRSIALTRKNALFAGSEQGAESWAIIASLVECCKLNGVDPEAYSPDVLGKLLNLWPNERIEELMPWAWARTLNGSNLESMIPDLLTLEEPDQYLSSEEAPADKERALETAYLDIPKVMPFIRDFYMPQRGAETKAEKNGTHANGAKHKWG